MVVQHDLLYCLVLGVRAGELADLVGDVGGDGRDLGGLDVGHQVLGLIGIAGMSVNYILYQRMLEKGKDKYGADILALAKEIAESQD